MNNEYELIKPSTRELEECLEPGVMFVMNDGTSLAVLKYDDESHSITLSNNKVVDLFSIYSKIDVVLLIRNLKGEIEPYGMMMFIWDAIFNIMRSCKYHPYLSTIIAYLVGDEDHYIYPYCANCDSFGRFKDVDEEYVELVLNEALVKTRLAKAQIAKNKRPYYLVRKNIGKKWPKPRKK